MDVSSSPPKEFDVLLVDDSEDDIELTALAFEKGRFGNKLSVARDGVEGLRFLRREGPFDDAPRPDLILLDLNMPRMDGRTMLGHLKSDEDLHRIPVVVLTTSDAEHDVRKAYDLHANSYLTKPVEFGAFVDVVKQLADYWLSLVKLPPGEGLA